jgi:hypothetical protein
MKLISKPFNIGIAQNYIDKPDDIPKLVNSAYISK